MVDSVLDVASILDVEHEAVSEVDREVMLTVKLFSFTSTPHIIVLIFMEHFDPMRTFIQVTTVSFLANPQSHGVMQSVEEFTA